MGAGYWYPWNSEDPHSKPVAISRRKYKESIKAVVG